MGQQITAFANFSNPFGVHYKSDELMAIYEIERRIDIIDLKSKNITRYVTVVYYFPIDSQIHLGSRIHDMEESERQLVTRSVAIGSCPTISTSMGRSRSRMADPSTTCRQEGNPIKLTNPSISFLMLHHLESQYISCHSSREQCRNCMTEFMYIHPILIYVCSGFNLKLWRVMGDVPVFRMDSTFQIILRLAHFEDEDAQ